jgi:protocatechuate 3,4-dioxygenase beta subunit
MSNETIEERGGSRRGGLTRRRALGLAGLAGAAYVAGPLKPFGSDPATDPEAAGAAASCVLAPEVTEGPYWVDERLDRSDVTGGQSGVPLSLALYVYRADDSCEPEQGAIVDIWHCNASGLYSDEASNSTSGQTWLRGYQETDATGLASFKTIFPSWYAGRTIHVHVRVRTFSGTSTTYDFTTQIFFSESDAAAVLATSPYNSRSGRDTTNASDMIYKQEETAGNVLLPTLSGSASAGYSGTVGIGLSGLPAGTGSSSGGSGSSSGGSGSSGSSGSSTSADKKVEAKLLSRKVEHRGERRDLELRIDAGERVAATAQVMRGGTAVARKTIGAMKGTTTVAVPLGNDLAAGPARLRLTLTDRAGNQRTIRRSLRIPAP